MKLSRRLDTIASFVREGSKIADIGTDHGYIPIYLMQEGIALSALAMDVRPGPLKRAGDHILEYGLTDKITTRLSDGLTKLLPGEADTVIIAGMGGGLTIHILEEGRHVWETVEQFILSPQSDIEAVRRFLAENGFFIERESMVKDEGKYYTVMKAVKGSMTYEKTCHYRYGKCLLDEGNQILTEYLEREFRLLTVLSASLEGQGTESADSRLLELADELAVIEEARDEMQRNNGYLK